MYPSPFRYHRAGSLQEASRLLEQLGEESRLLAGGQSLIPLMKFRLVAPTDLIDLNFIPDLSYVRPRDGGFACGALTRHIEVAALEWPQGLEVVRDCARGIADVQVRNRGTLAGSLAEADPSGDWAVALGCVEASVQVVGPEGERSVPLPELVLDAYTTSLGREEVISEVRFQTPPGGSGAAYLAFKRCAQVYASASVGARVTLEPDGVCREAAVVLGCVGLTAIPATEAAAELSGKVLDESAMQRAAEAAAAAAEPESDMRGSAAYKRELIRTLVERALGFAARRAGGEKLEVSHYYV